VNADALQHHVQCVFARDLFAGPGCVSVMTARTVAAMQNWLGTVFFLECE